VTLPPTVSLATKNLVARILTNDRFTINSTPESVERWRRRVYAAAERVDAKVKTARTPTGSLRVRVVWKPYAVTEVISRSSMIKCAIYVPDEQVMFIQFESDVWYQFIEVPSLVFTTMVTAESVGKYFHAVVKGKYESRAVE